MIYNKNRHKNVGYGYNSKNKLKISVVCFENKTILFLINHQILNQKYQNN